MKPSERREKREKEREEKKGKIERGGRPQGKHTNTQ
jgi:hypothetical protein